MTPGSDTLRTALAFASDELASQLYFARQLATASILAPDASAAWRTFKNWQNQ